MEQVEFKNTSLDLKSKSVAIPEKLKSSVRGNVVQSISILLQQIKMSLQPSEYLSTSQRIIKVLVRGIASSNTVVQKNYFVALETIISTYKTTSWFSLNLILDAVESELHISKSTTKGDEGEILLGRVLVFGVLVRSGALITASVDEQVVVFTHLLKDMKGKSYLPLIADPFLIQYLKEINKSTMKKVVWPLLQKEVSPGPDQLLVMYHILLVTEERFPSVVSSSYLQQTMGASRVLSTSTIPGLLTSLQANFRLKSCNHPVYTDIIKYLTSAEESILQKFWEQVDKQLLVESSSPTNKHIMAIKFFSLTVSHLDNASQVPGLLTPKLILWFLKKHKGKGYLQAIFNDVCREAIDNLCKLCSKPESSKAVLAVIKKLIFGQGSVLAERGPGTRVIQQLSSHLSEKGVMKLVAQIKPVIINSGADSKESTGPKHSWHNVERLHATHFFCNLLALPVVRTNSDWRLEQLTFLFDLGFFPTSSVGVELAGLIRDNFYSCLYHKLPSLVELRNLLAGIVKHINSRLDCGEELRIKVSPEVLKDWKKMFMAAEQFGKEKKYQNQQWVTSVFQTMFYHIGLHLFKEPAFASDVLEELHSVCKRVSGSKNGVTTENEPHWTEVVVEMILSLLSQNSHLHRHLIGCIFGHFCPLMTPQNVYQILQVLDPSNSSNPLLNSLDTDSESSSDEGDVEDNNEEGEEDMESSDDGMSDDIEEEIDEKANDKLRRAVFEALGDNGALTDVESVDLDEMDEAEAARVDKALSEAFRANRQTKTTKPAPHTKALTTFRIRVLDLLEVWAASDPPLDLLVDTILALIALLEHSVVDRFQAPLEARVRSVIKKLTSTKKYNVSDYKSLKLGNVLKSLLEKRNRTTTVYMSIVKELSACTVFIVKASQHVPEVIDKNDPIQCSVFNILKNIVDHFFHQRDCLLPVALYNQLFQQNIPYIVKLAAKLPDYAFDSSVHPFRRNKALEFLMVFLKNNRTLSEASDKYADKLRTMSKHLYKESVKMMEESDNKIKPNFLIILKQVFDRIHKNKWMPEVDWEQHIEQLVKFQKSQTPKREKKLKPIKNNTKLDAENSEVDNSNNDNTSGDEDLHGRQTKDTNGESEIADTIEEEESSSKEGDIEDKQKSKENLNKSEESQKKSSKKKLRKKHSPNTSHENGGVSNDDEQDTSKSTNNSEGKRNQNRTKHTQLLKKNSKQLRLASMAEGLEDNVFGKYRLLESKTT